jgi:chemotaxis signal transduction protein
MPPRANVSRLHALEIPLRDLALLVPSATIAEIVTLTRLTPLPFAPPWAIGVVPWRTLAVPVVSFEALLGRAPAAPAASSKIVVFYPLTGRREWEFFGVLTVSEPRPRALDGAAAGVEPAAASELPASTYVASGIKLNGHAIAIPDLEAMRKAFYP